MKHHEKKKRQLVWEFQRAFFQINGTLNRKELNLRPVYTTLITNKFQFTSLRFMHVSTFN